jgi:RibD domain-containing protein
MSQAFGHTVLAFLFGFRR